MSEVGQRWTEIRGQIDGAARDAGRAPGDVVLVAVSKFHPARAIVEAFEAGARDFGESYVQEMITKREEVESILGEAAQAIRWHFIGHLQRNKAKMLGRVAVVHSVDSGKLLQTMDRRAPDVASALVQVRLGGEDSKSGLDPAQARDFVIEHAGRPGCALRGLMTIPPPRPDLAAREADFQSLRALLEGLRGQLGDRGADLVELSMGMSDDFVQAVRCGSTMVRVGTAIFGRRQG